MAFHFRQLWMKLLLISLEEVYSLRLQKENCIQHPVLQIHPRPNRRDWALCCTGIEVLMFYHIRILGLNKFRRGIEQLYILDGNKTQDESVQLGKTSDLSL